MLERLSGIDLERIDALVREHPAISGGVVLATCNRFELYLDGPFAQDSLARNAPARDEPAADDSLQALWPVLAETFSMPERTLRESFAVIRGERVPEYLFAVSSGLESIAVGEGEISGQVRRALERARGAGLTTPRLEQLFQTASTTSRGVKQQTALAGTGRSLVRLALELASSSVGAWERANVLLVGTGAYAGASLKALRDRGVRRVHVYSPSGGAHRLADREGVVPVEQRGLRGALAAADLVVTCSSVDEPVIRFEDAQAARLAPGRAPATLLIDLGMPRNVDPLVARIDGVELLDIETLRIHAPLEDLGAAEEARCIVARAADEFTAKQAEADLGHAIAALRRHITGLTEREIARAGSKDPDGAAAASLRRLANTFLHEPSMRAKELARQGRGEEFMRAIEVLFGVMPAEQAETAAPMQSCPYLIGRAEERAAEPSAAAPAGTRLTVLEAAPATGAPASGCPAGPDARHAPCANGSCPAQR